MNTLTPKVADQFKKLWLKKQNSELAEHFGVSISTVKRWADRLKLPDKNTLGEKPDPITIEERVALDKQIIESKKHKSEVETKYKVLLKENELLKKQIEAALAFPTVDPVSFTYKPFTKDSESVAIVLASDWHLEEKVRPETVDGFNEYTLDIAKKRAEQFFRIALRLTEIQGVYSHIDTICLALLGDFISSNIHEALLEINQLQPIDALIFAEEILIGGIQYLLDNSKYNLIIPCHMGNHSRITKKVHIATEDGNSLEKIMYYHIKNHFKDNPRVKILISPAYLSYVTFWGYTICFQHGHAVQYQGGIGGLTIPLKKAVSQWQKKRRANLYVLGHWHSFLDINEAIVNGSMIGYSSYVQFIKGDPERPKQAFFVVNKKYNEKLAVSPILFDC